MNEAQYRRIVEALEHGRRSLFRARLTAGILRFVGVLLVTVLALVVWAMIQRWFRIYNVPLATLASLAGAGVVAFALVRWVIVPWIRMPDREAFVALVEKRFPEEKNLIVNAYQLGDDTRATQASQAPDLVEALVHRASARVKELDLRGWRDPAPDRPFLWAGGAALATIALLALVTPALLTGALGQIVNPRVAEPPPVALAVNPGDIEVDRGTSVPVAVTVDGTGEAPVLHFRERNGSWRTRRFGPTGTDAVTRDGGAWEAMLTDVDRNLEYRVTAPRAESDVFAVTVREKPRLAGFRAHLDYPDYTGLPTETVSSGTGDLTALKGTRVDLRVLTNRELPSGYVDWRPDAAEAAERVELAAIDPTTWSHPMTLAEPGSYAVVFADAAGNEVLRSPRYRVDPAPDRPPFLTLHFPQEDHDLAEDMMERIVADAADDYGFSAVLLRYRIDDGAEQTLRYTPYGKGQKEFRLDTLWDVSGLGLLPGSEITYYVEVRDNDTVSGPKAVRSPVRRVRFPTLGELYEDVAEDHGRELDTLADVQKGQEDLREQLDKLNDDLKRGRELDWEMQKDVEQSLQQQTQLEQQVSEVVERLEETLSKANSRAQMSPDLVQKMSQINEMLENLSDQQLKRNFQELSRALERMDRDSIRRALENFQASQEEMLQGMERTIELLKQIQREEQMEDLVQRTDEIAWLQEQIAKEMEKLEQKRRAEAGEDMAGEPQDGQGEPQDGEGEPTDDKPGDPAQGEKTPDGEQGKDGEQNTEQSGEQGGEQSEAGQEGDSSKSEGSDAQGDKSESEGQKGKDGEQGKDGEKGEDGKDGEQGDKSEGSQSESGESQKSDSEGSQSEGDQSESKDGEQSQSGQQGSESEGSQEGQQGEESQSGESGSQQGEQSEQQSQSGEGEKSEQERLQELAEKQKRVEEMVEELKRRLEMLRKLNEESPEMAQNMEELQKNQLMQSMQENMQQAQQGMSSGQQQEAAPYTFQARDEANSLAGMTRSMQQQMMDSQEDQNVEMVEKVIKGLIDVSGVEEQILTDEGGDSRELAQKQYQVAEAAGAMMDTLDAVMKQSFALGSDEAKQLRQALTNMARASDYYEQGNRRKADHKARESAMDVNQTIVQLMKSHQSMCSSGGGGGSQQMRQQMEGLTQNQRQLNQQTRQMMEQMAQQQRLSMTDQQRMEQLAAQQEMIRQGLQDLLSGEHQQEMEELLGELPDVAEDMEQVEDELRTPEIDPRVMERQQQILSRLLDAQRSVRQREMSPQRQSQTATLAERQSPPPIPEELLRRDRTLEEDVLRGADDHYPAQYRQLVEEYFRSLSKENRTP